MKIFWGALAICLGCFSQATDLFVTSGGTNSIIRYDGISGAFISAFVPTGGGGLSGPQSVTFGGPHNNAFVASGANGRFIEYDGGSGAFVRNMQNGDVVGQPYGCAIGPDGNLYGTGAYGNAVHKWDTTTGNYVGTFTVPGAGGLAISRNLLFASDGFLYVGSNGTHTVKKYDATTGSYISEAAVGGGLSGPDGLALGADGKLYVADETVRNVLKFDPVTAAFISVFIPAGSGGLVQPRSCAFGPDGNFYVVDKGTNTVRRYNGQTGQFINIFASGGGLSSPDFPFFGPTAATVGPTAFTMFRGIVSAGGLSDLQQSDDSYLFMRPGVVLSSNEFPIQLVVETVSPFNTLHYLRFTVESASLSPNIAQRIDLYNFTTGSYVQKDMRALGFNDTTISVEQGTNAGQFVESGTHRLISKISFKATGPILSYPWYTRVDFTSWYLSE